MCHLWQFPSFKSFDQSKYCPHRKELMSINIIQFIKYLFSSVPTQVAAFYTEMNFRPRYKVTCKMVTYKSNFFDQSFWKLVCMKWILLATENRIEVVKCLKPFIPADQYSYLCKQCKSRWINTVILLLINSCPAESQYILSLQTV